VPTQDVENEHLGLATEPPITSSQVAMETTI